MELANIEKLIEKYENAETSLQEEQELKDYFQQTDVPGHLLEYQAMFNYFDESNAERFTKSIPLKTKKTYWKWLSVAAAIAIMFSIYTYNANTINDLEKKEAEFAYQETQKALQMVSKNLNKGSSVAIAGLREFEKTQNKIFITTK